MTDGYHVGGLYTDVIATRHTRVASCSGVTINASSTPFISNGGTFQVTAGHTFHVTGVMIIATNGTAGATMAQLVYADDAAISAGLVSIGFDFPRGAITGGMMPVPVTACGVVGVPATKYIGIYNGTAANFVITNILLFGYEE